jgi:hypothetical protein
LSFSDLSVKELSYKLSFEDPFYLVGYLKKSWAFPHCNIEKIIKDNEVHGKSGNFEIDEMQTQITKLSSPSNQHFKILYF